MKCQSRILILSVIISRSPIDSSWNDGYGNFDLDEFIFNEFIASSDSDDEDAEMMMMMSIQEELEKEEEHVLNFKGSIKGRRVIPRDRIAGARLMYSDYFTADPTFPESCFRHRYRMSRNLFLHIVTAVEEADDNFKLRKDCCGQLSFSPLQKCTAALRMLAYGKAADAIDTEIRMEESTVLATTVQFARTVVKVFGAEYLREPTVEDTEKLLAIGEAR